MPQASKNSVPLGLNLYRVLLRKIVDGDLTAREQLPSERLLSEEYGVHRGVVREALKRLEAQNLIETHRGRGTRILDFRQTGGLDLLETLAVDSDGLPNLAVIKDVIEWREDLGAAMTRRATLRNGKQLADSLDAVVLEMRQADLEDLSLLQSLSLRYWDEVADASENLAYRLALNSFKTAYEPFRVIIQPLLRAALQDIQGYQGLADVIRIGDGDNAGALARAFVFTSGETISDNFNIT